MTPNNDGHARIANFLRELEAIPWFGSLGAPIPECSNVKRISTWEEWPGPESEGVIELSLRQQSHHDEVMANAKENQQFLSVLWVQVRECVIRIAAPKVPYDPKEDCYHAPNTAVWQAAWTAGLMGLCLYLGRKVPDELNEQWNWYVRGHWPCGYSNIDADNRLGPLVVY